MDHVDFLHDLAGREGEPGRADDAEKLREIANYLDDLLMEKYGPRI